MARGPSRLIRDERQLDLVAFLDALVAAHAAARMAAAFVPDTLGNNPSLNAFLAAREREPGAARPPKRMPAKLPFMVESVSAFACYTPAGDWLADDATCNGMLAAAVLHSAWKDASWVEKAAWRQTELKGNADAVRKRSRKADNRLSGISFFLVPPPPPSAGWCASLDSWCDVLGFDAGVVRACVEAHLRNLSPLHGWLCDYALTEMEPEEPAVFFNRNKKEAEHDDAR